MSIIYKLFLFITLIYLISMFVHVLGVFPYTPFSDIATTDAAVYGTLTDGGSGLNQSRSILDLFFYYDANLGILGNYHITSLSIMTLFITVGVLAWAVFKVDIKILITCLIFGMFLTMLNSSWTFITKIVTLEGGVAMTVFVMIIGIGILFIVALSFFEKATQNSGGAED